MSNARRDIEQYQAFLQQRRLWEPTWEKIARLTLPRKSGLQFSSRVAGARLETQYTSVAIRANELLAASIQGSLTSSVVRWFALANGLPALAKNKGVAAWYEDFSDRLYINLTRSNFHQEMQEVYLDLGAFGTGCILMDEKKTTGSLFGGFRFQAQEIATYVIGEDGEGHVDVVYRILKMSPRAIIKRWGAAKAGARINTLAASPETAEAPIDILHGVYPREGARAYSKTTRASKLPVASCYIDLEGVHTIEESGFHEMPVFAPRWTKVSGETYGRGPGFTALGDVSTMDEATKLNLQAWAFAIRPPLVRRHDGVIGTPKVVPGGYIDVYDMDSLRPLESGANVQIDQINREALQTEIRNAFFWEQLQLPNQQILTATEVQRRLELMQRVLGPTLGRLEVELHQKVIMRGAAMMLRAGEKSGWQDPLGAPQPPGEILEAFARGIADVDVQYLGPLARAQKTADVESLSAAIAEATPIIQLQPDSGTVMNGEECVRFVFERRGLPSKLTRSKDEVKEITDQMNEQRKRQAEEERLVNLSQVAKNAGPAMQGMQLSEEQTAEATAQGAMMGAGA